MKRRIIFLVLLVCILTAFAALSKPVHAAKDEFRTPDFSTEEEFMRLTIYSGTGVEITPTESYYIQDTSGNETIVCIEFSHSDGVSGFGLIDLVDYTVTMIALDAEVPFDKNDTVIYGGVLSFAVLNDDEATATVLGSEKTVPASKLYDSAREEAVVTPQSQRTAIIEAMDAALATDFGSWLQCFPCKLFVVFV